MLNSNFKNSLLAVIPAALLYARALTKSENDADDILQESLLKAFERKEQFEEGTNIEAWLITIIRNTFRKRQKSFGVTRTESLEAKMENSDFDIKSPGEAMETIELSEVEEFINDLPEQERVIIRMIIEGRKYQEIADALRLTRTNVGVLLCRARRKMHEAFPDRLKTKIKIKRAL